MITDHSALQLIIPPKLRLTEVIYNSRLNYGTGFLPRLAVKIRHPETVAHRWSDSNI